MTAGAGGSLAVTVAGRRLDVDGDSGIAAVAPAFAGLLDGESHPADATFTISTTEDPSSRDPWRTYGIGSHRTSDGALAVVRFAPPSVETFIPGDVPRLRLEASPESLASGDIRAQPGSYAIASWLASSTMQCVHGAAVALEGRAVLLVGVGGRGKSTTALACAQRGFTFLGDDLCIVESTTGGAYVHGIYATAKLNPDSRQRLDAGGWPALGVTPKGKVAVALPASIRFDRGATLVAIVGVRADGAHVASPRPLSPGAAVGLLSATALRMATGSGTPGDWLRVAVSLARGVPAYEVVLSWDLDRVCADIMSIVSASREQ